MNDRLQGTTWSNPIWYGKWRIYISDIDDARMAWAYAHDDYDGAPDAGDYRCGYTATVEACKAEIDWMTDGKIDI